MSIDSQWIGVGLLIVLLVVFIVISCKSSASAGGTQE